MKKLFTLKIAAFLLFCLSFQAIPIARAQQAQAQTDINERIRREGMENSQIMRTLHYFTDLYGPRLTGSPQLKAAGEWAVRQMTEWGMENAHLDPWDFGHPGWVNDRASGFITAPVQDSLVFEVLAWTPGTRGVVSGEAFQLNIPTTPSPVNPNFLLPPTQEELTNYFNSVRGSIKGKIVLVGRPARIPVNFDPPNKRLNDEELRSRFDPNTRPQPAPAPAPAPIPQVTPRPGQLNFQQLTEQLNRFLLENGAVVRINDAGREHGQIRAFANGHTT